MPVRNADPFIRAACENHCVHLETMGHRVHFPPRDAPQDDPTGSNICKIHRDAMLLCNEVHVMWDESSKGSHFDLGMAYGLGKKIVPIKLFGFDSPGKSYWKAVVAKE